MVFTAGLQFIKLGGVLARLLSHYTFGWADGHNY